MISFVHCFPSKPLKLSSKACHRSPLLKCSGRRDKGNFGGLNIFLRNCMLKTGRVSICSKVYQLTTHKNNLSYNYSTAWFPLIADAMIVNAHGLDCDCSCNCVVIAEISGKCSHNILYTIGISDGNLKLSKWGTHTHDLCVLRIWHESDLMKLVKLMRNWMRPPQSSLLNWSSAVKRILRNFDI